MSAYKIWHLKTLSKKSYKAIRAKAVSPVCTCTVGFRCCTFYYQAKLVDDMHIIDVLSYLAQKHPRYDFRKLFTRIRLMGHGWNHKRVYRIYCGLKLNLKLKTKKWLPTRTPEPLTVPTSANDCWSMDFMSDNLYYDRHFRTFNVINDYNRELLAIEIALSLPSHRIIRDLSE